MIEIIKEDVPRREWKTKTGKICRVYEARTDYTYRADGRTIATATTRAPFTQEEGFFLSVRTDYTLRDYNKSTYERALSGIYQKEYKELFEMLGITDKDEIDEYLPA